jgi:hypothetical protein
VGHPEQRGITEGEVDDAIAMRRVGRIWFRGIDVVMWDIIRRRDIRGLLRYGVRGLRRYRPGRAVCLRRPGRTRRRRPLAPYPGGTAEATK